MIKLADKAVFDRYHKIYPLVVSEHAFANLFAWNDSRPLEFLEAGQSLLIFQRVDDCGILFGPPIGGLGTAEALAVLEKQTGLNALGAVRILDAAFNDGWIVSEDRDNFDYVYKREDLTSLNGRKYHAKRNLVSQCLSEYDCHYEEINQANIAEVKDLTYRWCKDKGCGKEPMLCAEFLAVSKLLEFFDKLDVFGAAIRINGRIEAFTVAESLNPKTVVIHFEKAMPDFKGLYQLINNWFCKNALSDYEFVNREQDLGVQGLKKAKESYFPDHYVKKYSLYRGDKPLKLVNHSAKCD